MSTRKAVAEDGPYPLPDGWRWVKLGEVAEINPRDSKLADDTEISFVGMAQLDATTASAKPLETRPFSEVSKGYTVFRNHDVLVAKITPCWENGKVGQAELDHEVGVGSTEFHVVRPSEQLDSRYILHFLRQSHVRSTGELRMTGSAGQRRVPTKYLSDLNIPLAPLPEQQRIAEILDSVGDISDKSTRRGELIRALRISTFREMFPEETTATIALGEICKLHSGSTPSKKESRYWNGQIPWFSAKDLKATELHDSQDHVSQDALDETSLRTCPAGSIAMVVRGMILAHTFPVSILRTTSTTNQDLKVIEPSEEINTEFLAAALKSRSQWVLDRALTSAHGTKRLEMSLLESIPIPDVSTEMQGLFAARVSHLRTLAASFRNLDKSLSEMLTTLRSRAFRGEL